MRKIVIDASVVLKWIPGKNEIEVEKAVEIFKAMMKDKLEVYAPTFLLIEVLNILIRKRKLRRDIILESMQKLSSGKIKFIDLDISDLDQIEEMMCKFGLTAYDAIYLNLARIKGCKVLTTDKELLKISNLTVGIEELLNGE